MNVVFLTNYITHHQMGFCEEMNSLLNGHFTVIVFRPIARERKELGFTDNNSLYPYILRAYDSAEAKKEAYSLCAEADVVIYGSAPMEYLTERRKRNKVTFVYTERIFKQGRFRILDPRVFLFLMKRFRSQKGKNQYYLCAGGYVSYDINLVTNEREKMYKWGYFPRICEEEIHSLFEKKNHPKTEILWVGRLIDWKHSEAVVRVATFLKKNAADFVIKVVGSGDEETRLRRQIAEAGLQNEIILCGAKTPDEVEEYYERADVFLATSDKQEGWGAVINEAMSYGCAVVASHEMGSVPFLIQHNENGMVFRSGDWNDLSSEVLYLIQNPEERNRIAKNAYGTIRNTWNVKIAANRLVKLLDAVLNHKTVEFEDGPCSRAKISSEKTFLKMRGRV